MKKRKWHIKPRIFFMFAVLLILIFSSVFFAFNLFIHRYIRSNVETQLNEISNNLGRYDGKRQNKEPRRENGFNLPDLSKQPKNRIGANAEIFIIDLDFTVIDYAPQEDFNELSQIASYMKDKGISPNGAQYVSIKTEQEEYYISSKPGQGQPNTFMVFYINVSAIYHLVNTVNLALVIIVTAAMAICFFIANIIANSVTSPVKKLSSFAIEIGKGNFEKREFYFTDIEFDELADSMNRSAEKLDKYNADQQSFFQNVSHELRTPLMSIHCYAEGIESGLMDGKKAGATIISETNRLTELVEDLLYISRIDNITNRIEKHENDLRDTIAICAESLKIVAGKKNLRFVYQFDDEPVLFCYNEKHMYRAFINLISNAIRYAKSTITLSCYRNGDEIEASVTDDGEGVSPDDLPYIFERFYKGRDGKHGIGLSIVKSVVELHDGKISAKSGDGTSFNIVF